MSLSSSSFASVITGIDHSVDKAPPTAILPEELEPDYTVIAAQLAAKSREAAAALPEKRVIVNLLPKAGAEAHLPSLQHLWLLCPGSLTVAQLAKVRCGVPLINPIMPMRA